MTKSDTAKAERRRRALALLGVALVQTVSLAVFLAIGVGGVMAAAVVSIRHFGIGQPLATIILIGAVLLWIPAFFLAMRASSMVAQALSPRSAAAPRARVEISGLAIECTRADGSVESVLWSDLQEVHIVNEDAWPIGTQYWLLIGRGKTGAVIPSDAEGAQELLVEMQKRLPGFDNRAVIVAMGALNGSYKVWPTAGDEKGTD